MSEWKEYKLGEIAIVNMGQSPKSDTYNYEKNGLPFFQGNRNFGRLYPTIDTYCTLPTKIAEKNDILFSVRAPVGDINYSPVKVCIGRGLCSIRMKSGNQNFLFYLLNYVKQEIINKESGTVFGSVNKTILEGLIVKVPPLPTQTAIAEILSSLDDKIELNNKINQELETIAQTLFKQWFIAFEFPNENGEPYKSSGGEMVESELGEIPKGWSVDRLGDHLYIKGRIGWKGLKTSEYLSNFQGYSIVNGSDFLNEQVNYASCGWIPEERYEDSPEIKLNLNDILITKDGTIGKLAFVNQLQNPTSVASGIFVVRPNSIKVSTFFCWSFFKSPYFQNLVKSRIDGSVIPHLYQRDFVEMFIPLPSESILNRFELQSELLFKSIFDNKEESKMLANLRDTLLPKLISGELEINEIFN